MRVIAVRNATRKTNLGRNIRVARTLLDRAIGLLSSPVLREGEGMYLSPCRSIHTFFMRYPIDVLFLDEQGKVLYGKTYRPWRVSRWLAKSQGALELAEGSVARSGTQVGDQLKMEDVN